MLLLANGPRFCVGGDVRLLRRRPTDPGAFVGQLAPTGTRSSGWSSTAPCRSSPACRARSPAPRVGLLGACDLVVCARSTKIRPAYGAIGFSPDGGTSWALTRSLGRARALDLMLTNGSLTAAEAHLTGLVARLVEDDDLREAATELVAGGSPPARSAPWSAPAGWSAGRAIRTLDEQLDDEAQLDRRVRRRPRGREGVPAFVEKRAPDFRNAR